MWNLVFSPLHHFFKNLTFFEAYVSDVIGFLFEKVRKGIDVRIGRRFEDWTSIRNLTSFWVLHTPYAGAAGMLLGINGKWQCENRNHSFCSKVSFLMGTHCQFWEVYQGMKQTYVVGLQYLTFRNYLINGKI